jgi:hypothetical protein
MACGLSSGGKSEASVCIILFQGLNDFLDEVLHATKWQKVAFEIGASSACLNRVISMPDYEL